MHRVGCKTLYADFASGAAGPRWGWNLDEAIPQINVFSINIELKVLIGLVLLLLLISPFSEFLLQTEITMLDSLRELLAMTG